MELSSGEIQQTARAMNIQKKIIRIIAGVKRRVSCRELFKEFNIFSLQVNSYSLLLFIVENMEKFETNSDIHSINTRHKHDLHYVTC
jgi:hypothetical protein